MDYIAMSTDRIADLYPVIVYGKPPISDLPPGTVLGTWAYSVPGKVRFILDRELEVAPGVLPGDLARTWIRDEYKLPIRRRKNQMVSCFTVPLHARLGKHGLCSYIDIRSAYATVLRFGYDVEYVPNRYIASEPRPVPREIKACKFAYSIAVAMSHSLLSHLDVVGKQGVFEHTPLNLYSNPCLYALAQDTLNGIGSEIVHNLGSNCVYANTDGYIVKEGFEAITIEIIRSWGFDARIREEEGELMQGETEISGVASYRIGKFQTERFDPQASDFTGPLMDYDQRHWLKTELVLWSQDLH